MAYLVAQFAANGSLGSKLIEWYDHGLYSHVDIVLPDGSLLGARDDVIYGVPKGVQIRPAGYVAGFTTLKVELEATDVVAAEFYRLAYSQIGKAYDSTAIAGFAANRDWRAADSWFCSEFFMWCLEGSGFVHKLSAPCNKIAPDDALLVCSAFTSV
jgi:hypothetical protein